MSFEEEHTADFLCFSSSYNPSLSSPEFTLYTVRKDFMDPLNEDIKCDLQRLHCWLESCAKAYRFVELYLPLSSSPKWKMYIKPLWLQHRLVLQKSSLIVQMYLDKFENLMWSSRQPPLFVLVEVIGLACLTPEIADFFHFYTSRLAWPAAINVHMAVAFPVSGKCV